MFFVKKNHWLFIVLSAVLVSSCYKDPVLEGIHRLAIDGVEDTVLQTRLQTKVHNPNRFAISGKELTYSIIIKNDTIGKGTVENDFSIPANETASIEHAIRLNVPAITRIFDHITSHDSVRVDVDLALKFSKLNIKLSDKMSLYVQTQKMIDQLMTGEMLAQMISIKNIKPESVSLTETRLNMKLQINNTFNITYRLDSLHINIFDDKKSSNLLGSTRLSEPQNILPMRKKTIPLSAIVKNLNAGKSLLKKMIRRDKSFYLSGHVYVYFGGEQFAVPLNQKIDAL